MNTSKRRLFRSFGALTIVSASTSDKWVKPIVNSVLLPAHAETTTITTEPAEEAVSRVPSSSLGFSTGSAIVFDNDNAVLVSPPQSTNPPLALSAFIPAIASNGSYLEQSLSSTSVCELDQIDLSFYIDDQTDNSNISCAQGQVHTFNVLINGIVVGNLAFRTPSSGPAVPPNPPRSVIINVGGSYTFPPITGTGGTSDDYTIRVQATSSVCNAVGAGGNYRFLPSPAGTVDLYGATTCA